MRSRRMETIIIHIYTYHHFLREPLHAPFLIDCFAGVDWNLENYSISSTSKQRFSPLHFHSILVKYAFYFKRLHDLFIFVVSQKFVGLWNLIAIIGYANGRCVLLYRFPTLDFRQKIVRSICFLN